ncbi:MAG: SAM-dependent methyltransferase [Oscillospiraceae bacterium]|nr:SAM-dependent methyltransferase [Oscillospiraceae bacterium]
MKEVITYVTENKTLRKLTLSKCTDNSILRATGRLIEIKGVPYLALETFYADGKVQQKNIPVNEVTNTISQCIPEQYKQLNISTTNGDCEVKASKKGKITVIDRIKKDNVVSVDLTHNRQKQYIIPADTPVDFLIALGVQDPAGFIYDKKRAKFRQINRFLEIVADVESNILTDNELYILDLCCGKSYLSFAVYYYFTVVRGCKVTMDCVDLKKDVIEYCASVAEKLHYDGLHFIAGDIRDFPVRRTPDLTVSLHACDIATDIVLAKGMDSGSRVILSTPCCHHEMMHQLKPTGAFTDFLLEHSILKQKLADAATDALRCKVLEINGYDVTALELIDPEETPKNVLIRGIKRNNASTAKIAKLKAEYKEICDILGIHPYLRDKYLK